MLILGHLSVCLFVCPSASLPVCQSVRWVICGKTDEWIGTPFGVLSGIGRAMGVLDEGKRQFWG